LISIARDIDDIDFRKTHRMPTAWVFRTRAVGVPRGLVCVNSMQG